MSYEQDKCRWCFRGLEGQQDNDNLVCANSLTFAKVAAQPMF
jgi:hypothetical protein